jgi:rare lipoprotein A
MRLPVNQVLARTALSLGAVALLGGCAAIGGKPKRERHAVASRTTNGPAADYPIVLGAPFDIDGTTHTPVDVLNYDTVGYAITADAGGNTISAASKTLPLPSYVEVTALETGKTILVRVERRGPMRNDRLIELSPGAAMQLGTNNSENAPVRVRRVNPPEFDRALLRSGQQAPARMDTPKPLLGVLMRRLPGAPAAGWPSPGPKPVVVAPPPPVVAPPKVVPVPPRQPVAPAPVAGGSLLVQVGAFSTRERANSVAGPLDAHVVPSGQLWRVRLGPYAKQAQADAALAKARAAGYSDARIQRAD